MLVTLVVATYNNTKNKAGSRRNRHSLLLHSVPFTVWSNQTVTANHTSSGPIKRLMMAVTQQPEARDRTQLNMTSALRWKCAGLLYENAKASKAFRTGIKPWCRKIVIKSVIFILTIKQHMPTPYSAILLCQHCLEAPCSFLLFTRVFSIWLGLKKSISPNSIFKFVRDMSPTSQRHVSDLSAICSQTFNSVVWTDLIYLTWPSF